MEKFPKVRENQLVLIRVEASTGNVLDENFAYVINDSQKVHTIFDSISA